MEILHDADIERIQVATFVDAISEFLVADFEGRATSPPRQRVDFPAGSIAFTSGGLGHWAGFRAYEAFNSPRRVANSQITAVWDTDSCALKGVCFGSRLGAIRTGVLGGIAVDALAPSSVSTCAVIGTGLQAETQVLGMLARRRLAEVRVYSRKQAHRNAFADRLRAATPTRIVAFDSPEDAVSHADIVVLATDSGVPVIDAAALDGAVHITTVGPKFRDAHELPLAAAAGRLIVSDSPQQIRDQGQRHMLFGRPCSSEIRHLGEMLALGRPHEPSRSLYLSAGLAGTEVVALATALAHRSCA